MRRIHTLLTAAVLSVLVLPSCCGGGSKQAGEQAEQTEKTMKAVGASLALGAAVAMAGSAMNDNPMRNVKKTAKKAINTFSNIVENMQSMM